jgi:hypothetical protein
VDRCAALLACAVLAAAPGVRAATRAPPFFIAAVDEDANGAPAHPAQDRQWRDPGGGTHWLRSAPILTDVQLLEASCAVGDNDKDPLSLPPKLVVVVGLTPAGVRAMTAYSTRHIGGRLALVLHGEVELIVPIDAPLDSGGLMFEPWPVGTFGAQRLAAEIDLIAQARGRGHVDAPGSVPLREPPIEGLPGAFSRGL